MIPFKKIDNEIILCDYCDEPVDNTNGGTYSNDEGDVITSFLLLHHDCAKELNKE